MSLFGDGGTQPNLEPSIKIGNVVLRNRGKIGMMQSSCWSERNLSELNELLELARRTEQKIRELSGLTQDSAIAWRPNSETSALSVVAQNQG
jgi:hypothetical protein